MQYLQPGYAYMHAHTHLYVTYILISFSSITTYYSRVATLCSAQVGEIAANAGKV